MSSILPYYPLYVYDFDDDPNVLSMTLPEVGLYQLALNEAWKRGSIPDDPTALAVLIRRKPSDVKKAWLKVRSCWKENGTPGRLVNPRQEKERELALQKSAAASASIRKRWVDNKPELYGRITSASGSVSDSGSSGFVRSNTDKTSTRVRVEPERLLRMWSDHRGFKKPSRGQRPRILERAESLDLSEDELRSALDGFHGSEWAKAEGYPIFAFLKDPASWTDQEAPEVCDIESLSRSIQAQATVPVITEMSFIGVLPELAVRWNNTVTSGPSVEIWLPSSEDHKNLHARMKEPGFLESFDKLLTRAQALHSSPTGEAKFISFGWLIKSSTNWLKLANGGCDWVLGASDRQKKTKSKSQDALALMAEEKDDYGSNV